jgi:hypothetical protein
MHQAVSEHPVQFELLILQDVLKASFGAVLCQQACMWWIDTSPQKADQMVMVQVPHLWKSTGLIINFARLALDWQLFAASDI